MKKIVALMCLFAISTFLISCNTLDIPSQKTSAKVSSVSSVDKTVDSPELPDAYSEMLDKCKKKFADHPKTQELDLDVINSSQDNFTINCNDFPGDSNNVQEIFSNLYNVILEDFTPTNLKVTFAQNNKFVKSIMVSDTNDIEIVGDEVETGTLKDYLLPLPKSDINSSEESTASVSAPSDNALSSEESSKNSTSSKAKAPSNSVVSSETPTSSKAPIPELPTETSLVYWGESGTKYHRSKNCRSFKGNTPNSGSIDNAIAAGRTSWCKICS